MDTNPTEPPVTRTRIQALARELYVRRGYEGFTFRDIADALGITRANIHYHFGSKNSLMTALIDDFVTDAAQRIGRNWTAPGESFARRVQNQIEDYRRFYLHFNDQQGARAVWSPIARLRLDVAVLGEPAIVALDRVNAHHESALTIAVEQAINAGELRAETDVGQVVTLLRGIISSCGPMTQDRGSFVEVERMLGAAQAIILKAWGARP